MRTAVAVILLLAPQVAALAAPADEAQAVIDRWLKAFSEPDVQTIVQLYAPDAVFLGTGSKVIVTQPADIRQYFDKALSTNRPRGARVVTQSPQVLSDSVVAITALDEVSGAQEGTKVVSPGRVTFVLAKRDGVWKIATFHRSAAPK